MDGNITTSSSSSCSSNYDSCSGHLQNCLHMMIPIFALIGLSLLVNVIQAIVSRNLYKTVRMLSERNFPSETHQGKKHKHTPRIPIDDMVVNPKYGASAMQTTTLERSTLERSVAGDSSYYYSSSGIGSGSSAILCPKGNDETGGDDAVVPYMKSKPIANVNMSHYEPMSANGTAPNGHVAHHMAQLHARRRSPPADSSAGVVYTEPATEAVLASDTDGESCGDDTPRLASKIHSDISFRRPQRSASHNGCLGRQPSNVSVGSRASQGSSKETRSNLSSTPSNPNCRDPSPSSLGPLRKSDSTPMRKQDPVPVRSQDWSRAVPHPRQRPASCNVGSNLLNASTLPRTLATQPIEEQSWSSGDPSFPVGRQLPTPDTVQRLQPAATHGREGEGAYASPRFPPLSIPRSASLDRCHLQSELSSSSYPLLPVDNHDEGNDGDEEEQYALPDFSAPSLQRSASLDPAQLEDAFAGNQMSVRDALIRRDVDNRVAKGEYPRRKVKRQEDLKSSDGGTPYVVTALGHARPGRPYGIFNFDREVSRSEPSLAEAVYGNTWSQN